MPKASAIASELRWMADILEKEPEAELIKPDLSFYHGCSGTKDQFIALSSIFPRPFKKGDGFDHDKITLTHEVDALHVYASIEKSKLCILVEPAKPAKYKCVPLLSLEEEESIA